MSVRTQPGSTALASTPRLWYVSARIRVTSPMAVIHSEPAGRENLASVEYSIVDGVAGTRELGRVEHHDAEALPRFDQRVQAFDTTKDCRSQGSCAAFEFEWGTRVNPAPTAEGNEMKRASLVFVRRDRLA